MSWRRRRLRARLEARTLPLERVALAASLGDPDAAAVLDVAPGKPDERAVHAVVESLPPHDDRLVRAWLGDVVHALADVALPIPLGPETLRDAAAVARGWRGPGDAALLARLSGCRMAVVVPDAPELVDILFLVGVARALVARDTSRAELLEQASLIPAGRRSLPGEDPWACLALALARRLARS